jgi:hypothetical protein
MQPPFNHDRQEGYCLPFILNVHDLSDDKIKNCYDSLEPGKPVAKECVDQMFTGWNAYNQENGNRNVYFVTPAEMNRIPLRELLQARQEPMLLFPFEHSDLLGNKHYTLGAYNRVSGVMMNFDSQGTNWSDPEFEYRRSFVSRYHIELCQTDAYPRLPETDPRSKQIQRNTLRYPLITPQVDDNGSILHVLGTASSYQFSNNGVGNILSTARDVIKTDPITRGALQAHLASLYPVLNTNHAMDIDFPPQTFGFSQNEIGTDTSSERTPRAPLSENVFSQKIQGVGRFYPYAAPLHSGIQHRYVSSEGRSTDTNLVPEGFKVVSTCCKDRDGRLYLPASSLRVGYRVETKELNAFPDNMKQRMPQDFNSWEKFQKRFASNVLVPPVGR